MNATPRFQNENNIPNNIKLEMLHEFALLLNSSYNIELILNESVKKVREATGSDGCHIMLSQCFTDGLKLKTAILDCEHPLPDGVDLTKGGVAQETFRTGQLVIVDDTMHDPRIIQKAREYLEHRSMAAVPLISKGETIGVMVVYSKKPANYNQSDGNFLTMLGSHLGLAVENARLIEELKKAAIMDSLTGAYNHRFLLNELCALVEQYRGRSMSLIMVDVDKFKAINDTYGHLAGDYVLQEVTKILQGAARNDDIVARYGGDEFAVVLPGADIDDTMAIGSRIEQAVANKAFNFGGKHFKVTVSWGADTLACKDIRSFYDIVRLADQKLYEMKNKKKRT